MTSVFIRPLKIYRDPLIDFVRLDAFFPVTLQLGFRLLETHKQIV